MSSLKRKARVAGLIYLSMALTAPFGLLYVPGQVIVRGDAAATASNIEAPETLFRLGIASALATAVIFLFTALALRELLRDVSPRLATQMVALVMVSVPIAFVNEAYNVAALTLASGGDLLSAFDKAKIDAFAMLFVTLHGHGTLVNEIFWGLWLLPFGLLVFRSGFLPRVLGVWLIINGLGYVVSSLTGLLFPDYLALVSRAVMPALFGEVAIVLWLVIVGAKERPGHGAPQ